VLSNIREILTHKNQSPYSQWASNLELWFIPTLNPEGYKVVLDGFDKSYRKNKRDANHNNSFDFTQGIGNDADGVDINRNFDTNWVHGDYLYSPNHTAGYDDLWDYYRGEAPFSENEAKALRDFTAQHHIIYSINWHSTRSGNQSLREKVIYSWNWDNHRMAPDFLMNKYIAEQVASKITIGNYQASQQVSRKGCSNDWLYNTYGTIQLLIECGPWGDAMQPDEPLLTSTVQGCTGGVKWLINRALRYESSGENISHSMITGKIVDAVTQEPLVAEVIVQEHTARYFKPRLTDPLYGQFWRPLQSGHYNITFKKKGYATINMNNVSVGSQSWTVLPSATPGSKIQMQPLPVATYSGTVKCNNVGVAAQIVIDDNPPDTVYTNDGNFTFQTYAGEHKITVTGNGYFPCIDTLQVTGGNHGLDFNLSPAVDIFSENWENGMSQWNASQYSQLQNLNAHQGHALVMTDELGGAYDFYVAGASNYIQTTQPIAIPANTHAVLSFWQHLYTEWDYDNVYVQVITNDTDSTTVYSESGKWDWWHPVYINLDAYAGQSIKLRFRLTDDGESVELTDPGWTIDDIKITTGDAVMVANSDISAPVMPVMKLHQNYPNPFNPETTIRFTLPNTGQKDASISIYNIKGQKVQKFNLTSQQISEGKIVWKADKQASGVYFYTLEVGGKHIDTRKAVLLK
jgi:hypothetical protein